MADQKTTVTAEALRERLSRGHPAYPAVNNQTKTFFVGIFVVGVDHVCRLYPQRPSDRRVNRLRFFQAMHSASSAAYCEKCNTCYLAEDPDDGKPGT